MSWFIASPVMGQPQSTISRNAVVPVFVRGSTSPAAVLRVSRLFRESRRHGFYRISLFRTLVAERVELELRRLDSVAAVFHQVPAELVRVSREDRIVIQSFSVSIGPGGPVLEGEDLRLTDSVWRLKRGRVRTGGREVRFERGTLHVSGPKCGLLTYESGAGTATHDILHSIRQR
jgi:hypothetical protein